MPSQTVTVRLNEVLQVIAPTGAAVAGVVLGSQLATLNLVYGSNIATTEQRVFAYAVDQSNIQPDAGMKLEMIQYQDIAGFGPRILMEEVPK